MTTLHPQRRLPLLHVRDEKASGTNGGTFTSGAWRTRDLTTVLTNEIAGASLASNEVTLPAGRYECSGFAPARAVNGHKTRLYDVTGAAELLVGTTEYAHSGNLVQSTSRVEGEFTLTTASAVRLEHQCITTSSVGLGMGFATGLASVVEVYADLRIWKVG